MSEVYRWFGIITLAVMIMISQAGAKTHTILVSENSLSPANTQINAGDTVKWVPTGGSYTTTSNLSSPKSWSLPVGASSSVVFNQSDGPGPFPYHIKGDSQEMVDTIFVTACTVCGDVNGDLTINSQDPNFLVQYLFTGGTAPSPLCTGNPDGRCGISIGDIGYLVRFLFGGGPAPANCDNVGNCYGAIAGNTVKVGCQPFAPFAGNDSVKIPIYLTNNVSLRGFSLGFHYNSNTIEITSVKLIVHPDTIPPSWNRGAAFDAANNTVLIYGADMGFNAPMNTRTNRLIAVLNARILSGSVNQSIVLDSQFVSPGGAFLLQRDTTAFAPAFDSSFCIPCTVCGDANGDNAVNISDAVFLYQYVFAGGPTPNPFCRGNADGHNSIDIADVVYIFRYIFAGGTAPANCDNSGGPGYTNLPGNIVKIGCPPYVPYPGNDSVAVPILLVNNVPIDGFALGFHYNSNTIEVTSADFTGSLLSGVIPSAVLCNAVNNTVLLGGVAVPNPAIAPQSNGLLATLHVKILSGPVTQPIILDSQFVAPAGAFLLTSGATTFVPEFDTCILTTSCANSTTDPVFLICPGGDALFKVTLKDQTGAPVVGDSSVYVQFSNCSGIDSCSSLNVPNRAYPIHKSNANGELFFYWAGGGCNNSCSAAVIAPCGTIATVPVRTFDINGDFGVSPSFDFDFSECNNYNNIPAIQPADALLFQQHYQHHCGLDPCERFTATLSISPDHDLTPGQTIRLKVKLKNNNFDLCSIGFISFYAKGFGTGGNYQFIQNYNYNASLNPGQDDTVAINYLVPGTGTGCFKVQFLTSCCANPVADSICEQSNQFCTAGINTCYLRNIKLTGLTVTDIKIRDFLPAGWSRSNLHIPVTPVTPPDSIVFQICTAPSGPLGDEGLVVTDVTSTGGGIQTFNSRVYITSQTGDCNGDSQVNITDVVYLIQYIFNGGPAPKPLEAGDVNCSSLVNISDAVYIINYIFGGGCPPCVPGVPHPPCP